MSDLQRNKDAKWWPANVDLPRYYSYRSILECIHHYDIGSGKNYYFFHNLTAKRWQVVPWDVDLTWGDHMYGNGAEPFYRAGLLQREPFSADYQARLIEIRDLLFNPEQTGALIDEYAAVISQPDGSPSMVDADRAKWDWHPIMSSQYTMRGKSDPGMFYKSSPTHDFKGMTQLMESYVERRSQWIDRTLLADARLPATPAIAAKDKIDVSAPTLTLQLASPASAGKVKWRLAEITDTKNPATKPKPPGKYEIDALWEAEGGASAEIPTKGLEKGHTYRIRARAQDGKGQWSHWSAPTQFTVPQ